MRSFYGQLIGSAVGAVVSAAKFISFITNVYEVPGKEFEVPTGYVWIFSARLVMGKGLPYMAAPWAYGAGFLFAIITGFRTWGRVRGLRWTQYIPGGIAVAVGKKLKSHSRLSNCLPIQECTTYHLSLWLEPSAV